MLELSLYFIATVACSAQNQVLTGKKDIVLSAIMGTRSKPYSIQLPATAKGATLISGDIAGFKLSPIKNGKQEVVFSPAPGFVGIARAKMQVVNSSGKAITDISLIGLSTDGLEGEHEAPLSRVIDALGFQVNIGWTSLANHARPELQGEELSSSLFRKSGKGKVEIIPVARYSPDFELPFGYYITSAATPSKHVVGTLAKAGSFPEHQALFPALASGGGTFDPGNHEFGFYATSPSHTAYSEDAWNMLFFPVHAVHATRIYPLKNKEGKLIENSYLLCFEEAKNGDYNDYVFLVKNIVPVTKDPFTLLFNGKNLNGWHTFLQNIGKNTDPNKNFRVEDNMLHVIGKDLGYIITENGFSNYHFKVDFKWGEKKWPPREDAKRDAGVCYNIPMNEPDSIWPQSIESQVQEGDCGDFWLLGFSTIKVDGIKNVPSAHTRMTKKADGEKPTGEWNTMEIISYNGKCVHIVNGVIVNVGEEASNKNGRILLQSEYSEIYYRNVKIRKL